MKLPNKSHWLPRPTRPGAHLWRVTNETQKGHIPELLWVTDGLTEWVSARSMRGEIEVIGGEWLPLVPECDVEEAFKEGWIKGVDYGLRHPKGDDCRPASTVMLRNLDEWRKRKEQA